MQPDQFLDGLVGLPLGASLQVLAEEDQSHDQGGRIIESDATNDLREEGCHNAHHVGRGRANRDEGIHIRAAVAQGLDSSTMKLPANGCPDGCGEHQQEVVLSGKPVHEKHAEDDYRQ